jgi:periplasmic protein CpxP/Spy
MMRRNIVIAVAVVAMSMLALYGQSALAAKMGMPARHGMQMTGVYDKLGLTPDQKAKLDAVRKDARDQMKAVFADKSLTREQRFAKLGEIRRNAKAQIDQVLTPDQRAQLKELMKARMEAKAQRFAEYLGLTADQQVQIKAIHKDAYDQMKAVKADTSLTADQRAAQIRQIRTTMHDKVMAVLTPEQRDKLAARKGEMRQRGGKCPVL